MISPLKKQRIAVAVSGGVDSLCAMLMLRDAGHEVFALHGLFFQEQPVSPKTSHMEVLRTVCASLAIPLQVVDLSRQFAALVIKPFTDAWLKGETPNPCSICNREIKFGLLLDVAMSHGADRLATGHYVRLASESGQTPHIRRGKDRKKDQSYFLGLVPKERLLRVLFPLGELEKRDCVHYVRKRFQKDIQSEESQDICFIRGTSIEDYLRESWSKNGVSIPPPGPVILEEKVVGTHHGLWRYTIGQRRGLGIPYQKSLYVLGKDNDSNRLIVAPRSRLGMTSCIAGNVNLFKPASSWPKRVWARFRHGGALAPAAAQYDGQFLAIRLLEKQFPTTRGQIAAIYDETGLLLAAGIVQTTGS